MQEFTNKLGYMSEVDVMYKGVTYRGFVSKHLYGNKTITIVKDNKLVKLPNMAYVTSIERVQA